MKILASFLYYGLRTNAKEGDMGVDGAIKVLLGMIAGFGFTIFIIAMWFGELMSHRNRRL